MTEPLITPAVIARFDEVLARGLCVGLGNRDDQMCIEAAICYALGEPHGDDPACVAPAVRAYKIALNDAPWSSPQARAAHLRALGIAQIGSKGVVDEIEFVRRLSEQTIRVLIPALFREIFSTDEICVAAAQRCEQEGTYEAAAAAEAAGAAAAAAGAAAAAAWAAEEAAAEAAGAAAAEAAGAAAAAAWAGAAAAAAWAATWAAEAAGDQYLILSAQLALDVLRDLQSPGVAWI